LKQRIKKGKKKVNKRKGTNGIRKRNKTIICNKYYIF
jgi:hypothetical protein